jgi:signal transduction histidine kinase
LKAITERNGGLAAPPPVHSRRIEQALARCLADIESRGATGASFDRAAEVASRLVPALCDGKAEDARAVVLESALATRELLDILLRARASARRAKGRSEERAERERAAEAALRALAEREDPGEPDGVDERRSVAEAHRRLLALTTDGVATVRPDGMLVHANPAARETLALRLSDLRNTPFPALFHDRAQGEAFLAEVEREGFARAREADLLPRHGRPLPVRIAAAQTAGPQPRVLVLFRDLTEIRNIRTRLVETEKLGAMAKIAGSVAHEIRNPLNALFLNADLLEEELGEKGQVPSSIEEVLRVMREEIERLNEIIKNYLSLSKLGNGDFERLDLNQIVQEFAEEAEEAAAKRGVAVDVRRCRGEAPVRGDRNMMRRVLVNLFQNAIDATPPGGRIAIGTRRLVRRVLLWVRDSGPGIPEEFRAQLFQPFFSTKERGTGLGLYLIREIVIAHGGKVALRTLRPHGTKATVLVPRLR